jgi:transposase
MRRVCCACWPTGWTAIDRFAALVTVPTLEEEDAKRPHREREHLVQDKQRIENRIEAGIVTLTSGGRHEA